MKNLFFVLLSFAFFVTSCTQEFVEPTATNLTESESVFNRTETIEISGTVASYEIIIEDIDVHLVELDNNPEGLVPAVDQILQFVDNFGQVVNINMNVANFEIIIEDIDVHLIAPNPIPTGLTLVDSQTLKFN